MKKFLVTVILVVVMVMGVACSNKESNPHPTEEIPSPTATLTDSEEEEKEEIINLNDFREVETSPENIEIYRNEVSKRLSQETFLSYEEEQLFEKLLSNRDSWGSKAVETGLVSIIEFNRLYKTTYEYYYPVVFRENNALVLWYTTNDGYVLLEDVYGHWNQSNTIGNLHRNQNETGQDEVISSSFDYTMYYNNQNGEVTIWSLNQVDKTYKVPKNSIYCGESVFEGHIFRNEDIVYGLNAKDGSIEKLASGVKEVILANYKYGSDPWSQPLFLMEDSTVKCYIHWEHTTPSDDISNLVDIRHEGGYRR